MTTFTSKVLAYAYPTSTLAKRLGHDDTGCWIVQLSNVEGPRENVAAYPDKKEAVAYFEAVDLPVGRYSHSTEILQRVYTHHQQ